MRLEAMVADDAPVLARVHATAFDAPWNPSAIAALLGGPGGYGIAVLDDAEAPAGFVLARVIVDEAEILTLAVAPGARRRGLGRALMDAAAGQASARGAASLYLEVAADNLAAIGLYRAAGFAEVGRRLGYYGRKDGSAADALIMRRDLNSALA